MKLESPIPEAKADESWETLYQHLRERVDVHVESAVRRNGRYKRIANFLHISIPGVSLALTAVATSTFPRQQTVTAALAILVTLLTGVNSILEPARRYMEYVERAIELHDLKFELESTIRKLEGEAPEKIEAYLLDLNGRLSVVGRKMAGLPIPKSLI